MSFINPNALWFALLAIPILLFYLLKIRRKEVEISSTMLWRMALRDQQANAPWQKLRRNLLLLLQLIVLSMMVLAAARLAFPFASVAGGSVVLLIDGSASMQATDTPPDRFTTAIRTAERIVRQTGTTSTTAAILVTHEPRIIFTAQTGENEALQRLAAAQPAQSEADWPAALALAAGLNANREDQSGTTFIILSDGGLPSSDSTAEGLPPLPGEVQFIPIGTDTGNLALSALSARVLPSGDRAELFVRVSNYGETERAALLHLYRNDTWILTEQLRLPPGAADQRVIPDLPVDASRFEARIENIQADLPLDSFPNDDSAYAVLAPPADRSVLLVTKGNLFLERLLLLFPNLQSSKTAPDDTGQVNLGNTSFDLYIFDGFWPADGLPDGNLLFIRPPANDLFTVTGDLENPTQARLTDHPLVAFIDWADVHIFRTAQLVLPDWGRALITNDETPLAFIGQVDDRRIAVVGFDLHDSDLPLNVAFPILFANLLDYLAPQGMIALPNGTQPDQPVELTPPTGSLSMSVSTPGDEALLFENPGSSLMFTETKQPGIYQVRATDGTDFMEAAFTVNLFSKNESSIAVRDAIDIGRMTVTAGESDEISRREVWGWLIGLALLFLLLEWVAYQRRLG